ncbi:hypothetical protein [Sphingomonas sp. CFBP 13706]|uniref:hypothetical protein n=1 Tax=Sphingomonas sp. CFBP 13706 TaxID=2775314 RepID=UPI00177F2CB5|nr:hypothetical protein [Sphingomonas sp. CFBP 13706]MBD8734922.1 hypothetical protein [Sphingomonas sp. CFBP 13706]
MSLKAFLTLTDNKLREAFLKPEYDPTKARAKVIASLDKAVEQFGRIEPTKGKKMWKVNNKNIELTLPFAIDGEHVFYSPAERFPDLVKNLKAAINAGELDSQLEEGNTASPQSSVTQVAGGEKKQRAGWSPERRKAQEAAIAAKRAAAGK